jgi:hypothetical protein
VNPQPVNPQPADAARLPLSAAQEAIWLEQCLRPDVSNGGFFSVTLRGRVADEQVRRACLAVTARHPALRCTAHSDDPAQGGGGSGGGGPYLIAHPSARILDFTVLALPCEPAGEREAARAWQRSRPVSWDLAARPPVCFNLLIHGEDRRTLVVDVHHIGFDGRSKFAFARQFGEQLRALRDGGADTVHDAAVHDEPAAAPHDPQVPDDEVEAAARFWLEQGLHDLPPLRLPVPDSARGAGEMGGTDTLHLPQHTLEHLSSLVKAQGTSLLSGLLAGLCAQLWCYGNSHAVLAVPADTSTPQTRESIGLQVNTVPCIVPLGAHPTFRELVQRCGEALSHVNTFRTLPFPLVLRRLRRMTGNDLGYSFFSTLSVSYPRVRHDDAAIPGVALEWDMFAPNASRSFDLTLQLRQDGEAAYGRLDYSTAVFDAPTARDFVALFGRALQQAATPDEPLSLRFPARAPTMTSPPRDRHAVRAAGGPERVVCTVGGQPITTADVELAARELKARPGEPVAAPGSRDYDSILRLVAALEAGLPIQSAPARPDGHDHPPLGPAWAASQREAATAVHQALGRPARILNLHAPCSEAFAAAILRALAEAIPVDIPDADWTPERPELDRLVQAPPGTCVDAPLDLLRRVAAGPPPTAAAFALPMIQFMPHDDLAVLAASRPVVLILSDAPAGLLGWHRLAMHDDDSWSRAPGITESGRELAVVVDGRIVPDSITGLLAAGGEGREPAATSYRARAGGGVLRLLGRDAERTASGAATTVPEQVERFLARIPGIADAGALWNTAAGRFELTLVVRGGAPTATGSAGQDQERAWRAAIRRAWPGPDFGSPPHRVRLVPALPRTGHGDVDRAALRTPASAPGAPDTPGARVADPLTL